MKAGSRLQFQLLIQNGVFAILLVAAAFLIVWLLRDSGLQRDLTQQQQNTLSDGTQKLLRAAQGPIRATAYATPRDPVLGDIRDAIQRFIEPYNRAKPDLTLTFVDPREHPKEAAAANVRTNGEVVFEHGNRTERLDIAGLSEPSMANLLQRLTRERSVMYLTGHGEPKLDGRANFDLGDFGRLLGTKGFHIQPLNLGLAQDVPANISVLVIATPGVELLKGEVEKLKRYLERGGNLLWLIDQESLRGLQPLAESLGLQLTPGLVVDPTAAELRIALTIALATSYGIHPVTDGFSLNTAFPFVRQLALNPENGAWHATPLVEVAQRGWVETGNAEKEPRFDKDREVHGPVVVAVALDRKVKDKDQRVVVVGTSQFLSNQFVGMLSNLDLGTNMLNWLSQDDSLIAVQPRPRVDSQLNLGRTGLALIGIGFFYLLPAAFLFAGGVVWWRRRKA
jgi:ABC-type uncharacterized transport system involved in gliding motility auxiliary subunit